MRFDDVYWTEALYLVETHLHVVNAPGFVANATENGRWDNSYGYVTHEGDYRYTVYAYEPVP